MLERNDFKQRYESGTPIALHEFVYPVAVAYDSVAMDVDVELGGSDQLFNLLISRPYQIHAGQVPEICITVPLLEGLDGEKKMSKSLGNHIGLTDAPNDMFGKTMRIPDALLPRYARLAAWWPAAEVAALEAGLAAGTRSPMDEKKRIAADLVALYHGPDAARAAREWFERTIQRGEIPAEMPELPLGERTKVTELLMAAGFAESKRAAQRLIAEGGVRVDGTPVGDPGRQVERRRPGGAAGRLAQVRPRRSLVAIRPGTGDKPLHHGEPQAGGLGGRGHLHPGRGDPRPDLHLPALRAGLPVPPRPRRAGALRVRLVVHQPRPRPHRRGVPAPHRRRQGGRQRSGRRR